MMYLLAFGNPYLEEDNLAIKIADSMLDDQLKDLEIIKCLAPDEILSYMDKEFYILDVVKNAKEVMLIDDIDRLNASNIISMHDFDLGFFLKLMKETGRIDKVKIIGIPQSGDIKELKKKIIDLLPINNSEDKTSKTKEKQPHKEFMLVGVGNTLRADDGIGPFIANSFNHKDWKTLDTGMVPENFTSVIRTTKPTTVVIVDSAEMHIAPGEFRIVPKTKLGTLHVTTHAMPLSVLIGFIEEFVPNVIFIGIQPKEIKTDTTISPELRKSSEDMIEILKNNNFNKIKHLE